MPGFPIDSKLRHGLYDLKQIFDWWTSCFVGDQETSQKLLQEKLKYATARASREEMVVAEMNKELIRTEKVKADFNFVLYGLKQRLLSWSNSLPPLLEHRDARTIQKEISNSVWFILNELSQGVKSLIKRETKKKSTRAAKKP